MIKYFITCFSLCFMKHLSLFYFHINQQEIRKSRILLGKAGIIKDEEEEKEEVSFALTKQLIEFHMSLYRDAIWNVFKWSYKHRHSLLSIHMRFGEDAIHDHYFTAILKCARYKYEFTTIHLSFYRYQVQYKQKIHSTSPMMSTTTLKSWTVPFDPT